MDLLRKSENGAVVLAITGEVDLHASPKLRAELRAILAEKTGLLLIDFTAVEYIDSSGLATLIEYVREASGRGGKLALFGLKPKVRTIFDLVRLNELFVIAADREAAMAALAAKA